MSFHGRVDTVRCVDSLMADGSRADRLRVLVIDNGSYDGALAEVRAAHPAVDVLQLPVNLGFAGGMNVGIRRALAAGADTVTVLNNDTVAPAGTMSRLARTASDGSVVSPEVRYLDAPDTVWFGGGTVDAATGLARHLRPAELSAPDPDGVRATTILAGCCITAPASTWRRVGLFDERYFLNFEDSDWSLRAGALGVPLVVDTRARLLHAVSASFTGPSRYLGSYYYTRNGLLFGRERCGAGPGTAYRFVRRHVLPGVRAAAREQGVREGARAATVVAWSLADRARGRFGAAPAPLRSMARRWAA
nr:glycosyltransferase family 2 protein [Flexivirga meconopsidis]